MSKISVATCEVPLDKLSSAQLELKPLSEKREALQVWRNSKVKNQKSEIKKNSLARNLNWSPFQGFAGLEEFKSQNINGKPKNAILFLPGKFTRI